MFPPQASGHRLFPWQRLHGVAGGVRQQGEGESCLRSPAQLPKSWVNGAGAAHSSEPARGSEVDPVPASVLWPFGGLLP